MHNRAVTESDFRMPEYRNAIPEDYEFRPDGALVRKDRWENGIHSIRVLVGLSATNFEIVDVVNSVSKLVKEKKSWQPIQDGKFKNGDRANIRLECGSVLMNAEYNPHTCCNWIWKNAEVPCSVVAFQQIDS